MKMIVEYPKSNRRVCKRCGLRISKDKLSLILSEYTFKGFISKRNFHRICGIETLTFISQDINSIISDLKEGKDESSTQI